MKEVLVEAQQVGVDPDQIQACAGREDWEALRGLTAHRKRLDREAREAAEAAKPKEPLPVSEAEEKLRAAEAKLAEANATIREYDLAMGRMAADLDDQQQGMRESIEEGD